ncbi:septum formation family protein [Nocardioides zeae]|uniref:Septum formation family protein n=1 Tax=Nocardioides imazamoxiresistens TaxID=3231893 RepID=A0ABU3PXY8_9ACTN|nr:septum formation family protein [Nocardioides zeae]MDT9594112.1 septum formation family protein [Nocardioides zeae]
MRRTIMNRTIAAAGFALLAATTLAGCGSDEEATRDADTNEVTEAGEADVFSLALGDCIDDDGLGNEVSDVAAVPCAEPHDNEVFHVVEMEGDDWPGDEAVEAAVEEGCVGEFETFVGVAYMDSELDIFPLTPTQGSWEQGDDREILCLIYDPAGPVEGSLEGAAR